MALRTAYGNTISENGWPMVDTGSCTWVTVPGTSVSLQIQNGQPLAILRAFAADFNAYVEPLRDADSACWTPTNSVSTSNHLSGTAMDLNWGSHPFRILNAGFDSAKLATVRELLSFYEGCIFWGNDWQSPKDAMHFQMGYSSCGNPKTADFIARKIRADGYSTFRRGNASADTGQLDVLARALAPTGLTATRIAQLLPAVRDCLRDCGCITINRIAMWCAQIGHESAGLRYMEEIASGAAYEGRADLGNIYPGDGVRFKGRGPIQVTGRTNYTVLSRWAYTRGLVPTAAFFVEHPDQLASDTYGFIGVTWYWTTQRPMNDAADAQNVELATRYVNGGLNGIDDRRSRYSRCLAIGSDLLALTATPAPTDPFEELFMSDLKMESLSIYATPGEGAIYSPVQMLASIDAMRHQETTEERARLGDPDDIARVARTAAGLGKYRDAATVAHASKVLAEIEAATPQFLTQYLTGKANA